MTQPHVKSFRSLQEALCTVCENSMIVLPNVDWSTEDFESRDYTEQDVVDDIIAIASKHWNAKVAKVDVTNLEGVSAGWPIVSIYFTDEENLRKFTRGYTSDESDYKFVLGLAKPITENINSRGGSFDAEIASAQLEDDVTDLNILKKYFLNGNMSGFKAHYSRLDTSVREKAAKALALEAGRKQAEEILGITFTKSGLKNINQNQ